MIFLLKGPVTESLILLDSPDGSFQKNESKGMISHLLIHSF